MKEIFKGTADFEYIRKENALYVDKTEFFWDLISQKSKEFFLSRPRRFGKSLTISTLKAIFQGRKDLFDGLAISKHDYSWETYPIIHLSFGDYGGTVATVDSTLEYICRKLQEIATQNDVPLDVTNKKPRDFFVDLILKMSREKKVVVLIDEYDKIITDNIGKNDIADYRGTLADFYAVLKEYEPHIRFLLMTGVTKFSQVSIFSKLNNLTDISVSPHFGTMLGFTQEELESYFGEYLQLAAEENQLNLPDIKEKIKRWYDGFKFNEKSETVYNPVSVASFFTNGFQFRNYWFSTGTPTLLLKVMDAREFNFESAFDTPLPQIQFDAFDVEVIDPKVLLFQTGYLTIDKAEYIDEELRYYLKFPNLEVKNAFLTYFLNYYQRGQNATGYCDKAKKAVRTGDVETLVEALNEFFEDIPYDIKVKHEKYYQSMFYVFFKLCNVLVEAECRTSRGRVDAVILSEKQCFVCEFKVNKSAEIAMDQIKAKEYCKKYLNQGYQVTAVGANFDSKTGIISDVQHETIVE